MLLMVLRKNQVCHPNEEYLSDHRSEGINMAARCKIFVNVT